MPDDRFTHELKIQSKQIDQILDKHQLNAQVSTGEVVATSSGKRTTFNILGKLADGLEQARTLKRDLQRALQTNQIRIDEGNDHVKLNLFTPKAPVELLQVINSIPSAPPLTAVVGWSHDQRPILLNLKEEETSHVLIAGNQRSGKTTLLRSIILSLALLNRERDLQLAIINARYDQSPQPYAHSGLRPFNYLPHLLTPVIDNYDTAVETLQFLVDEIQYRSQHKINNPKIVVFIDHLVDLVEVCGTAALHPLTHIIRNGATCGIHLVLSTQRVEVAILQDIHDAYIPARLVGRVDSAVQAEIAADAYDTKAEALRGEGDFLAVAGQAMTHFQAAHVSDYDLHHCLKTLQQRRARPLLAHQLDPRPQTPAVHDKHIRYEANIPHPKADLPEPAIETADSTIHETSIELAVSSKPIGQTQAQETLEPDPATVTPVAPHTFNPPPYTGFPPFNKTHTAETGSTKNTSETSFQENKIDDSTLTIHNTAEPLSGDFDHRKQVAINDENEQINSLTAYEKASEPEAFLEMSIDETSEALGLFNKKQSDSLPFDTTPTWSKSIPSTGLSVHDEIDDDLIPFEWEPLTFETENIEVEPTPLPPTSWDASPTPQPAPHVEKNRFAAVRNLLSQIDETLPDEAPQKSSLKKTTSQKNIPQSKVPARPQITPSSPPTSPPESTAQSITSEATPPTASRPTVKRFNSVIPQARHKAKVATSLKKRAQPIIKSSTTKEMVDSNKETTTEKDREIVEFFDDWGQAAADVENQLPPDEIEQIYKKNNSNEPSGGSATKENGHENLGENETSSASKQTIRVLNDEKPPPPVYKTASNKANKQNKATNLN